MGKGKKEDKKDKKEAEKEDKEDGAIDKLGDYLQENIDKGEKSFKRALGLGQTPNVVPVSRPKFKERARPVEVGWHPVGGGAGKWFAEETILGKMITDSINNYPDPTQHWAVLVGGFAHQLWMDENFDVIYTNAVIKREEWRTFSVGETRFNDDAIRRAGETVIETIREKQPAYNLITNNCQTYALQLLDAIKAGGGNNFGTTLAIYERLIGPGAVKDLFDGKPDGAEEEEAAGKPKPAKGDGKDTVNLAQQVMDDNTTQLDTKEEMRKKKEDRKKGGGGWGFGKKDDKKKKKEEDEEKEKESKKAGDDGDRKKKESRDKGGGGLFGFVKKDDKAKKQQEEEEKKEEEDKKKRKSGILSVFKRD